MRIRVTESPNSESSVPVCPTDDMATNTLYIGTLTKAAHLAELKAALRNDRLTVWKQSICCILQGLTGSLEEDADCHCSEAQMHT
jgi:hypothetical protein